MVDLMGGSDSAAFAEFEDLCVLAFLAVRARHLKPLEHCVPLAFGRGAPDMFFALTRERGAGEEGSAAAACSCAAGPAQHPVAALPLLRRANGRRLARAPAFARQRAASGTAHARRRAGCHQLLLHAAV